MKARHRFAPAEVTPVDQNTGLLSIRTAGCTPPEWVAAVRRIGTTIRAHLEIRDLGIYPDRKEESDA